MYTLTNEYTFKTLENNCNDVSSAELEKWRSEALVRLADCPVGSGWFSISGNSIVTAFKLKDKVLMYVSKNPTEYEYTKNI